jgi:hypothetical protein
MQSTADMLDFLKNLCLFNICLMVGPFEIGVYIFTCWQWKLDLDLFFEKDELNGLNELHLTWLFLDLDLIYDSKWLPVSRG